MALSASGPAEGPRLPAIASDELRFSYVRSSGPGGQNVNRVSSKAVLRWAPGASASISDEVRSRFVERYASRLTGEGDLVITSERHRDQGRNAADCMDKLRAMIASVLVAPKKRKATRPTRGSQRRRLEGKQRQSEKKAARRGDWG